MQNFLTISRSVTKPSGIPLVSTTNNELTFFSFIFLAASRTDVVSSTLSRYFFDMALMLKLTRICSSTFLNIMFVPTRNYSVIMRVLLLCDLFVYRLALVVVL
jgi:hypothetical protein